MQVTGPLPLHIGPGEKAGPEKKMMKRMKEFAVEMGHIIKKMSDHMPEGLFGNNVFLAALLAIPSCYNGAAVKTVFFFALRNM
jgi:hypothetical protein